jgi:hypothetical protein
MVFQRASAFVLLMLGGINLKRAGMSENLNRDIRTKRRLAPLPLSFDPVAGV